MGTEFRLIFYGSDPTVATTARRDAFRRIAELDERLSDYKNDSELNKLCRQPAGTSVSISNDLFRVLTRSLEISRASEGAFDVTVGPAVRLWRRARRTREVPSDERIARVLDRIGYEKLRIEPEGPKARLNGPNMQLDLGGIAKGYATVEALKILRRAGLNQALVIGGGEMAAGAPPPEKDAWRIAISTPGETGSVQDEYLLLKEASVSTSGDASQFLELGGRRYSHIVNPRTGQALTQRRQATVVTQDGKSADGLASALCVAGPESASSILDQFPEAEARLDELTDAGWKTWTSKGWTALPKESRSEEPDK